MPPVSNTLPQALNKDLMQTMTVTMTNKKRRKKEEPAAAAATKTVQ
jgi:hypothetical protein